MYTLRSDIEPSDADLSALMDSVLCSVKQRADIAHAKYDKQLDSELERAVNYSFTAHSET